MGRPTPLNVVGSPSMTTITSNCHIPNTILLQARYYSISSSPKVNPNIVSVTSVVVDYQIDDRTIKGVCTNYLKDKHPVDDGPKVMVGYIGLHFQVKDAGADVYSQVGHTSATPAKCASDYDWTWNWICTISWIYSGS